MPSVIIPSTQLVEKKAMFLVSSGFSLEKSGVRVWGSDSPVREELSTWEMKHTTVIDGKNKNGKIRLSCWEEKQTFSSNIKKLFCTVTQGGGWQIWVTWHSRSIMAQQLNDAEVDGKARGIIGCRAEFRWDRNVCTAVGRNFKFQFQV